MEKVIEINEAQSKLLNSIIREKQDIIEKEKLIMTFFMLGHNIDPALVTDVQLGNGTVTFILK